MPVSVVVEFPDREKFSAKFEFPQAAILTLELGLNCHLVWSNDSLLLHDFCSTRGGSTGSSAIQNLM